MFKVTHPILATQTLDTAEAAMLLRAEQGHVGSIIDLTKEAADEAQAARDVVAAMSTDDRLRTMGFEVPTLSTLDYHNNDLSKLNRARIAHEAQGSVHEALADVFKAVQAEDRQDILLPINDLKMIDDGSLVTPDGTFALEYRTLAALLSRCGVFPRGASLMAALDSDVRAHVFNKQIRKADLGQVLRLRTRVAGDNARRSLFAVVSETYTRFDADTFAVALAKSLGDSDFRATATYDVPTTNFTLDATSFISEDVHVQTGDVFKLGLRFRSNDTGAGSIRGGGVANRPLCLNMSMIHTEETDLFRMTHSGSMQGVMDAITQANLDACEAFSGFSNDFATLRNTKATDILGEDPIERTVDFLVARTDVKRDTLVEVLLNGLAAEDGDTLADMVNAVTRAHTSAAIDAYQLQALESAAGELIPVWANQVAEA